jgi:aspartyl aminopeptidase
MSAKIANKTSVTNSSFDIKNSLIKEEGEENVQSEITLTPTNRKRILSTKIYTIDSSEDDDEEADMKKLSAMLLKVSKNKKSSICITFDGERA